MRAKLLPVLLNYHSNSHQWPLIAGLPAWPNQSGELVSLLLISTVTQTCGGQLQRGATPSLSRIRTCFENWSKGLAPFESKVVLKFVDSSGGGVKRGNTPSKTWGRHRTMATKQQRACASKAAASQLQGNPESPATGPKVREGEHWRPSQAPTFVMGNRYCFMTSVALKTDGTKPPRGGVWLQGFFLRGNNSTRRANSPSFAFPYGS